MGLSQNLNNFVDHIFIKFEQLQTNCNTSSYTIIIANGVTTTQIVFDKNGWKKSTPLNKIFPKLKQTE